MRTYLLRMALAVLTFASGVATARMCNALRPRVKPAGAVPQTATVGPPAVARSRRGWPEPRALDLELSDTETLAYDGYLVKRLYKNVTIEDAAEEGGQMKPVVVKVSYGMLARNGKVLAIFDDGVYHPWGNATDFGLVSLLGIETKQLLVSQSIQRGGEYWIVNLAPPARTVFCSGDWGVGRGENIRAIDLDHNGVDEIVDEITAFYDLQDKLPTSRIPLPEVIFKYDAKAKQYLPASTLHQDYLLRDLETAIGDVNPPDNSNHLVDVLNVTLQLIYAGKEAEGWAFYDKAYRLPDKEEIRSRVAADLRSSPVYIYEKGKFKAIITSD